MADKNFTPTKPHYTVGCLNKDTSVSDNIGVAWKDSNTGRIRIKLNRFIVLNLLEHDLVVTLFPVDGGGGPTKKSGKGNDNSGDGAGDGEIPF